MDKNQLSLLLNVHFIIKERIFGKNLPVYSVNENMKKFFAIISILNLVFMRINAVSKAEIEKHEEMAKLILIECKSMEGGTDEDLDTLLKGETFPETPTGKCMMTCVGEKIGSVSFL